MTVGNGGEGTVEIQNLLFTSQGALPGLVLMYWDIKAKTQGSVAMWGKMDDPGPLHFMRPRVESDANHQINYRLPLQSRRCQGDQLANSTVPKAHGRHQISVYRRTDDVLHVWKREWVSEEASWNEKDGIDKSQLL